MSYCQSRVHPKDTAPEKGLSKGPFCNCHEKVYAHPLATQSYILNVAHINVRIPRMMTGLPFVLSLSHPDAGSLCLYVLLGPELGGFMLVFKLRLRRSCMDVHGDLSRFCVRLAKDVRFMKSRPVACDKGLPRPN